MKAHRRPIGLLVVVLMAALLLSSCSPAVGWAWNVSPLAPRGTATGETTALPRPSLMSGSTQTVGAPFSGSASPTCLPGSGAAQPSRTFSSPTPNVRPAEGELPFVTTTVAPPVAHVIQNVLVDGQRLFFTQNVSKQEQTWFPNTLYEYDLQTGRTTRVATSVYGDQGIICCLTVSGKWISWVTYLSWGDGWQLFLKNLESGEETLVDRQENTGTKLRGSSTALSGDRLIWSTWRTGPDGQVKALAILLDLGSGQRRILAEAADPWSFGPLDMADSRVVWTESAVQAGTLHSNVYLYDLSSAKLTQMTHDDRSSQSRIHGDWMTWREGLGDVGPIVLYNLKSGELRRLAVEGDLPTIGDGLVMFRTYLGPRLMVYDIERNVLSPAFDTDNFSSFSPIYVRGRTIAAATNPDPKTGKNSIEIHTYER